MSLFKVELGLLKDQLGLIGLKLVYLSTRSIKVQFCFILVLSFFQSTFFFHLKHFFINRRSIYKCTSWKRPRATLNTRLWQSQRRLFFTSSSQNDTSNKSRAGSTFYHTKSRIHYSRQHFFRRRFASAREALIWNGNLFKRIRSWRDFFNRACDHGVVH